MLRVIQWKVWQEPEQFGSSKVCKFQGECRYRDKYCPFIHPIISEESHADRDMSVDPPSAEQAELAIKEANNRLQCEQRQEKESEEVGVKERIPKTEALIWKAVGDGACLFYCIIGENDRAKAQALRGQVAHFVEENVDNQLGASSITVGEALQQRGLQVEQYTRMVKLPSTQGG
jgi:hypothetical protein